MDSLHVRVPAAEVELVVDLLWQCEVAGIEERVADLDGGDDALLLISGPATDADPTTFWDRVAVLLGNRWSWHRERYDDAAAADAWRPFARAVEIGGVMVCPLWIDPPFAHPQIILLEPGRAWGHGSHPSTVLAGELLLDTVSRASPRRVRTLDVGCGSGVLSLLAAYRGASVVAIDIDTHALAVTSANAIRNGLEPMVRVGTSTMADVEAPFDVVAANLGIRALTELTPSLAGWVRSGGFVILSGLLGTQIRDILGAPAWAAWELTGRHDHEQWSAIRLQAPDQHRGADGR